MKILMASGGSGGHIYPALALAEELVKDNEVSFIGYKNHMEDKVINVNGYKFIDIPKRTGKYISMIKEYKDIKKSIKEYKPDIVIGWGNSLSFLSVLAAKRLGIKTIIHEQNIIPGKANMLSSKFVDDIVTSFDNTSYFKNQLALGNPRGEYATLYSKVKYDIPHDKKNILIVMGSLGSSTVSTFMMNFINNIKVNARFVISLGKNVKGNYRFNNLNEVIVYDYIESMPDMLRNVDLVISRAGATTISELLSLNKVSILIPSPYVANNHQYKNAKALLDKDLVFMVEEDKLDNDKLKMMIEDDSSILRVRMNLMKEKKKKGITDFVRLINDKYKK